MNILRGLLSYRKKCSKQMDKMDIKWKTWKEVPQKEFIKQLKEGYPKQTSSLKRQQICR
jgi:hypothetical protein